MARELMQLINTLSDDKLARLAQSLYNQDVVSTSDLAAFENEPPTIHEVVAELGSILELDVETVKQISPYNLARRILADASIQAHEQIKAHLNRAAAPTMSSASDAAVLIGVIAFAVGNLVHFEANNSGRGGKIKWCIRLGGSGVVLVRALRDWLLRIISNDAEQSTETEDP